MTALLLAASCSGTRDDGGPNEPVDPIVDDATVGADEPEPAPDDEPVLITEELAGFAPRSVRFSNVEFTVTGVRTSNQQLRSYAQGGDPAIDEDGLYAYLDITAVNAMSSTMTERLGPGHYKLLLGGNELDAAEELGFLSDLTGFIRANTGVDSFLAFPLDGPMDLAGSELIIGVPPDRRASLPLTGDVPPPAYPVEVELSGSAVGTSPTNPGTIEFTLLGATLAEDQPLEFATSPTGLRANEDELFLVIHLRAHKVSGGGSDHLGPSAFRLIVDGVPRAPWSSATAPGGSQGSPIVQAGAAIDVWVGFLVAIDASEVALQAGDFDADPAILPIELPPLP